MRSPSPALVALVAAAPLLVAGALPGVRAASAAKPSPTLPVVFEERGADFLARGAGYQLQVSAQEAALQPTEGSAIRMRVAGADPAARLEGVGRRGHVSYFLGRDRAHWRTGVSTYPSVRAAAVYPGVDLVYYSSPSGLEYDFEVRPGADPGRIALGLEQEGQQAALVPDGALELTGTGFRVERPVAYQEVDGRRRPVAARFVERDGLVRLALAEYDRSRTLVIDPVIRFSTFLGGGGEDHGLATAVDGAGQLLIAGRTNSLDFPRQAPLRATFGGGASDGFIAKLTADGAHLVWATYFGGLGDDRINDLAVDAAGDVYVTGSTSAANFPLQNPIQNQLRGGSDAFVTKLDGDGDRLLFSTYLGGGGQDGGEGIAIGPSNTAYVTGETSSTNFPVTTGAFQRTFGGGGSDAFVARLAANGRSVMYATYLGEREEENAGDLLGRIAVDTEGSAYVTGTTRSSLFPVTNKAFQRQRRGDQDVFLTKLEADGKSVEYSTFLGGNTLETAGDLAVDAGGAVVLTGLTSSPDFPVTTGAFQDEFGGGVWDAFVTRVAPNGETLSFSTFLGGRGEEGNTFGLVTTYGSVRLTPNGEIAVAGRTDSVNFPVVEPIQAEREGFFDAFVCRLSGDGKRLPFSTFLGGSANDSAADLAVTTGGDLIVAGFTASQDFPVTGPGQSLYGGGISDAWLTKISGPVIPPVRPQLKVTPLRVDFGTRRTDQTRTKTVTLKNTGRTSLEVTVGAVTAPFEIVEGGGTFTLARGKSAKVKLLFSPAEAGRARKELEITSTDPIREMVRVILVGRGREVSSQ